MDEATRFWLSYAGSGMLLVLLAWLGSRRRRINPVDLSVSDDPRCATCGYDVRGLPSDICPECGSRLSEVGVTTARYQRWQRVPAVLRAVVYTAGAGLIAAVPLLLNDTSYVPQLHRSTTQYAYGTPTQLTMSERIVIDKGDHFCGNPRCTNPSTKVLEHVVEARPGGASEPSLRYKVLTDRWELQLRSGSTSGSGPPPFEAVERFADAFAPESVDPPAAGQPVMILSAADVKVAAQARFSTMPEHPSSETIRRFSELASLEVPEVLQDIAPDGLLMRERLLLTAETSKVVIGPSRLHQIALLGVPIVAWLVGMPLVLRLRAVRGRRSGKGVVEGTDC